MKPPGVEVNETDEPGRGRKVYDQTIYVTALERGTRDRSPRRVEPLPDRIELKISPLKNHRGRMKFYRARSIPELCRITLKPTGETSLEQGRMEEVYITQYTHSFDREIEKPHIVAWKLGFEGSDVAHRDSKLCIVNSPVGSKPGCYPERRRSAPPGSFVFNYDALDMPEPVHRRSMSLGLYMDDPLDFDKMDSQVGTSAGGTIDTKVGESSGGKLRPLAHEMISAQKVEQVESVDSSFWDDAFDGFDSGENYNNGTNNAVRNNGINDVRNGDVTKDAMIDDVMTDGVTTNYVRSGDVTPDYVLQNGFNTRYDEITHDRDSREDSTQDPAKQALSLISTLRSTVKKPDSETFLRSVHETQTSKTFPESSSKNRPSMINQSKEPTFQEVSYRHKVPHGTLPRESPQKLTPRIVVNNPRSEFTSEIIPRKVAPQEDLPQDVGPQLNSKSDPEMKLKRRYTSKSEATTMITSHSTSKLDQIPTTSQIPRDSDPEIKRKYETKPRLEKLVKITSHSASELGTIGQARFQPQQSIPRHENNPQVNSMYSYQPNNEMNKNPSRQFTTELSTVSPKKPGHQPEEEPKSETNTASRNGIVETDKKIQCEPNSEMNRDNILPKTDVCYTHSKPGTTDVIDGQSITEELSINNPLTTNQLITNHPSITNYQESELESNGKGVISEHKTDAHPKQSKTSHYVDPRTQTKSEVRDTSYENYENIESSRFDHSKQVENNVYQGQGKSEFIANRTPTPEQENDYYQLPKPELNTMERSETSYRIPPKQVKSHRPNTASEQVTPSQREDYYQQPNIEVRRNGTVERNQSSYPKQVENKGYNSKPRSVQNPTSEEVTREYDEGYYQQPTIEVRTLETNQNGNTVPNRKSNFTSNRTAEQASNPDQNEDYYQNMDSQVRTLKTAETTNQDEDYYQQPNSRARTLKTVEINPSIHSKQVGVHNKNSSNKTPQQLTPEQHEGYYQQPNREVRKVETQNRHLKHGDVHNNDFTNKTSQNEQYYQQPKFEERRITTQTYPTEFETNTSLYEEPKDSTLSSSKCPLDQSVAQRNDKDYKKPLPEIPNERKTSESYYEMPMDTNPSPIRCPLDEKSAEKNERRDSYEQVVEHIYEQPNFATERVYEQFDYEKMKSPSNLVNTSYYAIPKSEKEVIYEQPDKNVYENINGGVDKRHPHSKLMNNEQPKAELSSSLQQENRTRSDIPAHESLPTAQINNDNTRENKNSGSTRYSGSSTNSLEHGDNLNREYSENTGSRYKNLDTKQHSTSSLKSKSNGQSTRVTYTGEVDTKKSAVSTTSSVRIDQSDGRISEGSPKSRSTSFEVDLLIQNPEVEVFEETPKRRTRHKARKTPNEEISQPSVYSKTTPSKASYSNTSLARFSSFNSEASYKRRLTSAWIEQQRLNFRKAVSREPSLRRTKSVEFHKERAPSEDTADYKLRHAKSELSFEHLNAMYNPFDDKYFDVNPDRQPAKVVHASPSQVITKAKSLERRVQKAEEPKSLSQVNTPTRASKDSLTITPLEKNAKHTNNGNRQQNLSMDGNLSRQDDVVTKSEIRPWGEPSTSSQQSKPRPKSEVDLKTYEPNSLSMDKNVQRQDTMPTREVKPRSGVRPKSADVSGFDMTSYNGGARDVPMDENLHKRDRMLANDAVKPSSNERPRVRPKSADVSGFDITNYNGGPRDVPMKESVHHKQDRMLTNNEAKPRSNQRPRVRPKSADVSGFDITTYNDEPTLKHSKSELSVNQLKAMYDPSDENSWFSPEPASQNVSQSDSRQVEVTVHDVVHRRTRSEPESRADRFKSGGKMKQPEPEVRKAELGSLEAEPKNITKLNSSSVLLLNVVAVGENDETKNPKFKRNAVSKSMSNIVSVMATEIENEKRLTTLESRDTRRESTRNVKPNKTGDHTVDGKGSISQNDKPIEKLRARYIIGGERASVRYLSKSSDELTSNDNDAMTKETSTQLQGQPAVKPVKSPKKDFGIRNFFGKIRRTKSEPNLDKNFDILDIDSDHGGKKTNSQKLKEDEKNVHETSPKDSQDKLQHSSKSGLKASSFYPKLKNFKKNFLKSKQSKIDGSLNDSGGLGQDISKSEEFLESSDFSEKDIKRENVELTESQDVVRPQNIESKTVDSPASSQSINPTKSNRSYTSKSEVPQTLVQIEQPPPSKGRETIPSSPTSPVMSPRSARKRFFQGGNRVTPVAVKAKESGGNRRGKEDKTASNVVVASHENHGDEGRITTEKIVEKNGRIARDTDIFVHASSPVTSTDNLPEKLDSRRMNDTTVKSAQPRFQSEPKSHEDKERFPSTSKESMNEEPQERTTSYRISEVSSRTTKSRNRKSESDENSSRFADSFTRGDDQNSTAPPITNTVIAHKNTTTYSMSTTNITKKSDSEESRSTGMNTQMNVGLNRQRNSLHEESLIVNTDHEAKDTGYKGLTVEINQDSTSTDLDSKHEELNTKDSKESETVIPKTKHRSFFSTKIFTSAGRTNSSQSKHKPEKKDGEEFLGESEVTREEKDSTTVDISEDPVKIGQDIELGTSNLVLKKEDNETTSKKNNSKEATKSREVLKEGKKTKNSSQTSREEKSEFGTKIKGFITKVLPQKDKSSSKENAGKEETVPGKTKVNVLEGSPDENNNATAIVSVTASPIEERKDTLSDTTTKSRRRTFVAKHLGESDSEKTRTSEDEGNQVKPGTIELDLSNKNERRTRYVSKVKHLGDSKTVKTGSVEKLSEKQSSFSNKKFTTLATNESYTTQRNIENGNDKMNATSSFGSRDTPGAKGVHDETVSKTEVLDNVEAFDSVFDFFEKAFNDQECKDGEEESLSKPEKLETPEELGKPESSMMLSTSTRYPEKNFGVAKESENKVKRHEKQFVKDTKQDFVVLNDRGERVQVSTAEVNLNTTDAKRKEIVSNMQNKGNTTAHVMEALESEDDRSLEEIKGFTIKHTKTSSLVLNKSMEDNLDTVGEDDDGDKKVQENLKHEELNIKQGNCTTTLLHYSSVIARARNSSLPMPKASHISGMAGEKDLTSQVKNKMAGEIVQKQNGVQWLTTQSLCIFLFSVSGLP